MHWDLSDGDREAGRAGGNFIPNKLQAVLEFRSFHRAHGDGVAGRAGGAGGGPTQSSAVWLCLESKLGLESKLRFDSSTPFRPSTPFRA